MYGHPLPERIFEDKGVLMKKRVLIDLHILKYPYCGLGQIAWNYARWFRDSYTPDDNIEVTLLVPAKYKGAFGDKVKYQTGGLLRRWFPILFPKFDIWHSTDQMPRFLPYSKDTKYVITVHDLNYEYEESGSRLERARRRIKSLLLRSDSIICISEFTKSEILRFASYAKGKPMEVIYDGVESLTDKKSVSPAAVKSGKPFFFTIGEVRKKKNFHVLLDVMKKFPDYELYIAGALTSEYPEYIRQRLDKENIKNVTLLGKVSTEEKVWLYRNCTAFFFPSLFEGFGLPVIEAMQFGKPVFCSDKTSLKEIGSDKAWFWTDFEPDYMVEVVKKGLEEYRTNPSLSESIERYGRSFTYEKNLQALFALYRRLIGV